MTLPRSAAPSAEKSHCCGPSGSPIGFGAARQDCHRVGLDHMHHHGRPPTLKKDSTSYAKRSPISPVVASSASRSQNRPLHSAACHHRGRGPQCYFSVKRNHSHRSCLPSKTRPCFGATTSTCSNVPDRPGPPLPPP